MAYCLGYARYVVSGTAITLKTAPAGGIALPSNVKSALIQNVDPANTLAWSDDPNTTPSATEGMQLGPGQSLVYDGSNFSQFRMIRAGGTDVTSVRVAYYSA
jgi:hypothetical protein